jgi:enoyl-CoA hydratase
MRYENIITETSDGILLAAINRPGKANTINSSFLNELEDLIETAEKNASVKGLVITGIGTVFSSGADLSEFVGVSSDIGRKFSERGQEVFLALENFPKPTIAAVNGAALGGGCELAMACHIRVAAFRARLGQPEIRLGIIPGFGGTQRLVRLVGMGRALELILTGEHIKAVEALRIGLVNRVTTEQELVPVCMSMMKSICKRSPVAIQSAIKCVNSYFINRPDGFSSEVDEFEKCFATDDFKEGLRVFFEKSEHDSQNK